MIQNLGRTEQEGKRLHPATENDAQFKIYALFISGLFHLIFLNHSWPWVTQTEESKILDKGGIPYSVNEMLAYESTLLTTLKKAFIIALDATTTHGEQAGVGWTFVSSVCVALLWSQLRIKEHLCYFKDFEALGTAVSAQGASGGQC